MTTRYFGQTMGVQRRQDKGAAEAPVSEAFALCFSTALPAMSQSNKKKAKDLLTEKVTDMVGSEEKMLDWIEFRSRFHQYSYYNTLLIMSQCPDAEYVMGYAGWKENGRQVQKGESGSLIMYPFKKTVENPEEWDEDVEEGEEILCGFGAGHVFDIKQTVPIEGEESLTRDDIGRDIAVKGDSHARALEALEQVAEKWGYSLERRSTLPGTIVNQPGGGPKGSVLFNDKTVYLKDTLSTNFQVKTLAHELAHIHLHEDLSTEELAEKMDRMEVQAEAAAYLVCSALDLDTSEYSFHYVASYMEEIADDADEKEIRDLMKSEIQTIDNAADRILKGLEEVGEVEVTETEDEKKTAGS